MAASLLLRCTLVSTLLCCSGLLFGARGVLKADGIIRVKGADGATASVTVVPAGAPAYSLPIGTRHFTLELPLDEVYLISVEREGCPTKEVYIDASVPVEMHASEFQFPFLVTLEHMAPEHMFAYEGPVGFVRYMEPIKDFGYETQYLVRVDEQLKERMKEVRATGMDPKVILPPAAALAIDLPQEATIGNIDPPDVADGTLAPVASDVPRLVHVVSTPGPVETTRPASIDPVPLAVNVIAPESALPSPANALVEAPPSAPERATTVTLPMPTHESVIVPARAERPVPTDVPSFIRGTSTREEEVIVEPRRVTRIVRFTKSNGSVNEFRKVTHAFGAIFYFDSTGSITERAFEEGTAQQ